MPELRIDPICGRRVYIAEDRAGRPSDYEHAGAITSDDSASAIYRADCPFCMGNESATPDAVATYPAADGTWRVRVVPNKFPAVTLDPIDGSSADLHGAAEGVHEVIVESPRHVSELIQLNADELAIVLTAYRDRAAHWARDGRMQHAIIFKNSGFAAGASLAHLHSQLVALPYVPPEVEVELAGAWAFQALNGTCAFCGIIRNEIAGRERVVFQSDGYVAMSAFAGRQPYECWILPERHEPRFDRTSDDDLFRLAGVLLDLLQRLAAEFRQHGRHLAYNLILHSGPFHDTRCPAYHWHWELVPRSTHLAGLEWGAGVYINPLPPEQAASRLRQWAD